MSTFTKTPPDHRAVSSIELSGRLGYDALADEYYDPLAHPTCYNMNRLSRLFLERHLHEPWSGETIEAGAGDSCVAAILHARGYALSGLRITDSSQRMLLHSERWRELGASLSLNDACELSRLGITVSLLVASLGDPYNTVAFWTDAYRSLKPGGRILFTMPSFEWSSRFRKRHGHPADAAEFVLRDTQRVLVPSFVVPLSEQIRTITEAGFVVTAFESLGSERLNADEPRSPKIDVFDGELSSVVWGFGAVRRTSTSTSSHKESDE